MKTNLSLPQTFFIIGMPRGGTTILSNLFNSLEDGFCLGEPHWYYQSTGRDFKKVRDNCFGKMDAPLEDDFEIKELLPWIEYRLEQGDYNLGGYKETWFVGHKELGPIIDWHKERVDFFLVVFRNPVKVHSSQLALGWTEARDVGLFSRLYKELDRLAFHPGAIPIVYEDFVEGPLEYLNERLPFQIEGELRLKPTGHKYGDPYANRSVEVEYKERETCIPDWMLPHHEGLEVIWRSWSKL